MLEYFNCIDHLQPLDMITYQYLSTPQIRLRDVSLVSWEQQSGESDLPVLFFFLELCQVFHRELSPTQGLY